MAHRGFALHDYRQHLLYTLRPVGYYAALFGIRHIARDPAVIGYDHVWVTSSRVERVAPTVASFLAQAPQPFFLSVGFFETHRPFPDPGDGPYYCKPPAPLPDMPAVRQDMAAFHAAARVLDSGVGVVLDALDQHRLADNTLVIATNEGVTV